MEIDVEPCGGDGISGGEFARAKLLGLLCEFLEDPINLIRAKTAMLCAPVEDRPFLEEAIENLQAGIDPGDHAIDAVLECARIFCGEITFKDGRIENDVGFVDDEPLE